MMQSAEDNVQPRNRRPWTEEEDEKLRAAIEEEDPDANPPSRWHAIAQHIPNRTNKDCRKRWWAQMATTVSKGSWTSDEDERLFSAVKELGPKWAVVASRVHTRNSGQCAKRWNDALNPLIDRSSWSLEEDEQLLKAVKLLGHSWAHITRTCLPGRTGLAAKNRYNHLVRASSECLVGRGSRVSASQSSARRRIRGSSASSPSTCSRLSSPQTSIGHPSPASSSVPSSPEPITDHETVQYANMSEAAMPQYSIQDDHGAIMGPDSARPTAPLFLHSDSSTAENQLYSLLNSTFCQPLASFPDHNPSFDMSDKSWGFTVFDQVNPGSIWTNSITEFGTVEPFSLWTPPTTYNRHHDPQVGSQVLLSDAAAQRMIIGATGTEYLTLQPPITNSLQRSSSTLQDLHSSMADARMSINCVSSMSDRASSHVTQTTPDPADHRVAIALAFCDCQGIGSTVHSLSQNL